jgi:hypothetical protein
MEIQYWKKVCVEKERVWFDDAFCSGTLSLQTTLMELRKEKERERERERKKKIEKGNRTQGDIYLNI